MKPLYFHEPPAHLSSTSEIDVSPTANQCQRLTPRPARKPIWLAPASATMWNWRRFCPQDYHPLPNSQRNPKSNFPREALYRRQSM